MPRNKRAKRIGDILLEDHPDRFDIYFDHNKPVVKKLIIDYTSDYKELANEIAGYITRYKIKKAKYGQVHGTQPPTPHRKKRKRSPYKTKI